MAEAMKVEGKFLAQQAQLGIQPWYQAWNLLITRPMPGQLGYY